MSLQFKSGGQTFVVESNPTYGRSYDRVQAGWFLKNWMREDKPRDFISNLGYTNLTGMRELMLVAQDVSDSANLNRTYKSLARTLFACVRRFIVREKELSNAAKIVVNFILDVKKNLASKNLNLLTSEQD